MTGHRPSLRLQITAVALVLIVAILAGAGVVLIGVVERSMVKQVDAALTADADFTNRSITEGAGLPTSVGPTDLYVQFVTADGKVLGAGTAAEGRPALGRPVTDRSMRIVSSHDPKLGDLRVLTEPAPGSPKLTIVLARSASSVARVRTSLLRALVGMAVLGSILLGLLIWSVVGRVLRPVEAMRETVSSISEEDLGRRLEPPGTGDELDRLAATLNDLLERLDLAVGRERQFVADASHELRTPLAAVRVLLETEGADASSVVASRAEALARVGQLQDLIDRLLVLAQADAPAGAIGTGLVDLDDLVLGQARQLTRTTDLRIDTSRVSGGQVTGRDTDLARVIENLTANATRYAVATIACAVTTVGDQVELTVEDDGPGIAEADRARIFERFSQIEPARAGSRGAGLGLSIAAAIVHAHGGTIAAEAPVRRGARFVVRLPTAATSTTPIDLVPPVAAPVAAAT